MNPTTISWVKGPDGAQGFSWNCFAGCSPQKPSPGCASCWAERLAATRLAHLPAYKGLCEPTVIMSANPDNTKAGPAQWTGQIRFFAEKLAEPLRRRKPSGIFVGDMGDIALLPFEQLSAVFGVMAACPQHRFYLLTKRPERLREWFAWMASRCGSMFCAEAQVKEDARRILSEHFPLMHIKSPLLYKHFNCSTAWPLPNVWVGASASTQADLDRVAPELLRIPAAVRFISYEPALEEPRLTISKWGRCFHEGRDGRDDQTDHRECSCHLDWVIVGGESGPAARPCHVEWLRSVVRQCRAAGVAPWVKQLGSKSMTKVFEGYDAPLCLRDRAGADMSEWPEDLRVREMPEVKP